MAAEIKVDEGQDVTVEEAERLLASVGVMLDRMLLQEPTDDGRPLRYNPLDYAILHFIELRGGCSGSDIARHLAIARTSVQSALDRLETMALIEKRASPGGGRVRTLHLTAAGVDMRRRMRAHDLVNMRAMLLPLTREERATVLPLLERVAASLARALD